MKSILCYQVSMSHILINSFFAHSHTGNNLYYCNVCGKRFVKESQLKVHMPTHNQDKLSLLECYLYGSKFDRVHGLRIHFTISHTMRARRDLRCPMCSKTFSKQNDLDLHVKVVSVFFFSGNFARILIVVVVLFAASWSSQRTQLSAL